MTRGGITVLLTNGDRASWWWRIGFVGEVI
jgi:hypothetical protein